MVLVIRPMVRALNLTCPAAPSNIALALAMAANAMIVALSVALGRPHSSVHCTGTTLDAAVTIVLAAVVLVGPAGEAHASAVGAAAVPRAFIIAVAVATLEAAVANFGRREPRCGKQWAVVV